MKSLFTAAPLLISSYCLSFSAAFLDSVPETLDFKNGHFTGSFGPLIECIHSNAGGGNDVFRMPLLRQHSMLESGELDVSYGLAKSSKRDEIATSSNPLTVLEIWLLSSKRYSDPSELNQKTIAFARGAEFKDLITRMGAKTIMNDDYDQAIKMAAANRVDAAVIPAAVANSLDADSLASLNKLVLGRIPIGIYVSNNISATDDIVFRINSAIATCSKNN